ncbi:hypothetical protein PTSG_07308 [Salpingoeca rosetta]|uniref:Uncharacterized protein n=1 Tax=Salpingoeca rosetta (strain ATCC 50818 / BSB-021) TaxID=946362 RepID=F2UJ17_SALR5|nr:uncharacterized protein PTSG_07308 [Salpingoeca rosetta]EGD76965.1 hypothetical protein PTSG_07308 [Salpingoeca rosetta]|eukprot:XP_004990805.1 hypothetical protein PTSG_07308 [Salpingoeca rosetta]
MDIDIGKLEQEWDIEDDLEDDLLHRKPAMPDIQPGGKISDEAIQQLLGTQNAGKPVMMFVTMEDDDREKNEELAEMYVASLKNNHMPVKSFFIEDDHFGLIVDDGKFTNNVIDFLKRQDEVAQVSLDQKDMLPPHPKTDAQKQQREKEKQEKKEKLEKLKALHKKKQKLAKKKRRKARKAKDDL